jgi:hypothetical protein
MTSIGAKSRTSSITVPKAAPLSKRSEQTSIRSTKEKIKFAPDNVQPVLKTQGSLLSNRINSVNR